MIIFRRTEQGEARDVHVVPPDFELGSEWLKHSDADAPFPTKGELHSPAWQLSRARDEAARAIDQAAEAVRRNYITPGEGQAMTYLLKEADARAYQEAGYPSSKLAEYSFVDAERQATRQTGREAADAILATAAAWRAKAAAIDGARRAGKVAVQAAETVEAVETAREAALAALAGL